MSTPDDTTKVCSKCGEEKPATREFFTWNEKKNRPYPQCLACQKQYRREWYVENRDRILENQSTITAANPGIRYQQQKPRREQNIEVARAKQREWYASHREQERERGRKRRAENAEKERDRQKVWRKANPEKQQQYKRTRRARRLNAPGKFTKSDLELQYKSQKGLCWWCSKPLNGKYHADHLIPLARGGTNWPNNIVCSCQHCNHTKSDKLPHEWNGRLF